MKLTKIGNNETELALNNGDVILFSYNTPVAAYTQDRGYIRTDVRYSITTTKHINKFIIGKSTTVPQAEIDKLVN